MADFAIGIVLFIVIKAAIRYIIKEKKRGVKCIGCPASGTCGKCTCNIEKGVSSDVK